MLKDISDWLSVISVVGLILFGGGGLLAWFKYRSDRKQGVRQENRADVDSLNVRAVAMIETQFTYLVKPLQDELNGLRIQVKELDKEVKAHRALYQIAVTHIRALYAWISQHMPTDTVPKIPDVPPPPAELAEDLQ